MTIKLAIRVCSVCAIVLLLFFALGPAIWQPRTGLGWRLEHLIGYFLFTVLFCLAWPRPFVVGAALSAAAVLLEGLQALTPDRHSNARAALYGICGVVAASLCVEIFIQARRLLRTEIQW
jgi:VanZ family protein